MLDCLVMIGVLVGITDGLFEIDGELVGITISTLDTEGRKLGMLLRRIGGL